MFPSFSGKAPFYEELVPKARLVKLNREQKLLLAALIVGATVFLVMTVGDYSWGIRGFGIGGLIFCVAAFIKLFESPCWIRCYDTELTFEQKTTVTSIKKEEIQFFIEADLIMLTRGRIPHAVFTRESQEKKIRCEIMPYYIPFYVPTMTARGVLVVATNRKYPTFIPTTHPTDLLRALERLTQKTS